MIAKYLGYLDGRQGMITAKEELTTGESVGTGLLLGDGDIGNVDKISKYAQLLKKTGVDLAVALLGRYHLLIQFNRVLAIEESNDEVPLFAVINALSIDSDLFMFQLN